MTTSQKAEISLLIAVLLFGGFSFLSFTGLFDLIETRFYNPSVTANLNRVITQNAEVMDKFFTEARERLGETLKTDAVRRGFLFYQRAEDISALSRIYNPIESLYGIKWVRFIDADGQKLLFSSYGPDILSGEETFPIYKDYNEPDLPYELIAVPEDGMPKFTFDERAGRVIFSLPLYDSFDIYRGTALFSLSIDAVSVQLISEGKLKYGEDITVASNPAGLLFGTPASGEDSALVLLSTRTSHGFFVGRLVNEEVFLLPAIMKVILLAVFFLTTYLIIFLLFNLRQDPLVVVQNRLRQLQISLLEQFYDRKGEADWAGWIRELEYRREEIRALLKRGVKADTNKSADMDILINKSWEELLTMLGGSRNLQIPQESGFDEEKIVGVLQKLLKAQTGASQQTSLAAGDETENDEFADEIEVLEELDEEPFAASASIDLSVDDESNAPPPVSPTNVDDLANQIEFSPDIEIMPADDGLLDGELEIVSPFSSMVFDFSSTDETTAAEENPSNENRGKNEDELNTDASDGLPLITTPFFSMSCRAEIETLESPNNEKGELSDGDVIREREGVHYISEDILAPSPEFASTLNPGFKELVDSVTK